MTDSAAGQTCGMAADLDRSCGTTWLTEPAPLLTLPSPALRPARLHRCGKVGQHAGHLCPCGSVLFNAADTSEGAAA